MDLNDEMLKADFKNFIDSLKNLLPKKKELPLIQIQHPNLTRLSDIHAEAKNVFPKCFTGAKVTVLREIMDRVKIIQEYTFGRQRDMPMYMSFDQLLHKELEPRLDGKIVFNPSGSVTANYCEKMQNGYKMRLTSKIRDIVSSETEVCFEKGSENSIGSIALSVKDMDPSNVKIVTQYIYRFTPEFYVGTEFGLKPLSLPLLPEYNLSARYEKASYALSTTVAKTGFQICLFKLFHPGLGIATVINEGVNGGPATFGFAMQTRYQNGGELKMFIDSQRCGGFTFQKDVYFYEPHNQDRVLRLIGSTLIDRQRRVRLGFGFNLDF